MAVQNNVGYYANMSVLDRGVDFIGQRSSDLFKLIGNCTSIAISTMDLKPENVRYLSALGRTSTKIMADGIDALTLPAKITSLFKGADTLSKRMLSVTGVIDSTVKLLKFGHATKAWSLGGMESNVLALQNASGVVTCGIGAMNDIGDIRRPAQSETMKWAKCVSLAKNVARVALNVLAFVGTVWGIATWSPLMLSLATVGTVGSIASFFLKQSAQIAQANGVRREDTRFKEALRFIANSRETMVRRFEKVAYVVRDSRFQNGPDAHEAKQVVGRFLASMHHESVNQVFNAAYVANGDNNEGLGQNFGRLALRNGMLLDREDVLNAIGSAYDQYRAERAA